MQRSGKELQKLWKRTKVLTGIQERSTIQLSVLVFLIHHTLYDSLPQLSTNNSIQCHLLTILINTSGCPVLHLASFSCPFVSCYVIYWYGPLPENSLLSVLVVKRLIAKQHPEIYHHLLPHINYFKCSYLTVDSLNVFIFWIAGTKYPTLKN